MAYPRLPQRSSSATPGSSRRSAYRGSDALPASAAVELEGDLSSGVVSVGGLALPVLVGACGVLEAADEVLLAAGLGTLVGGSPGGVETAAGVLELGGVEVRRLADEGLQSGVEVGERVFVEVAEPAGEVAVGEVLGVVPGGAGVRS
jgi:hypothetical protein